MSAAPMLNSFGSDLTAADYESLARRWISPELADAHGIRRADSHTVREMFGRKSGDLAGLIIPNVAPWAPTYAREYRARLDRPMLEQRIDGTIKEGMKYIQPTGRPNLLYIPVGVTPEMLADVNLPALIVEGEFKAIASSRLANYESDRRRFLSLAVTGVNNFRGTIGKTVGPNGDRRDVKGIIPDIERITWKGRRAVIAFDADSQRNPKVRAARWQLASALIDRGATVGYLEWPIEQGKGIDDRLANVGPEKVLADLAAVEFGDWHTKLIRSDKGKLLPCHDNAALLLENSPEWQGVLGYNEFSSAHVILRPPPVPVTAEVGKEIEDQFDTEVTRWLERKGVMVKPDLTRRVVDAIAKRNSFHPIRDYLEGLTWDETPRIGAWLIDYCGVEPSEYAKAVGQGFLISAVARAEEPGCKVDHTLVLEGAQGIGKSTAARILAGDEYFTDQLADMGSKDASMQLRGVWIVELSELDVLNRAETARAKAFLSQQQERFRLPYGKRIVHVPRQCVFLATTNADEWNKDETGGRRFWPVRCGEINLQGLTRDRDQLWAEAVHYYRSGAHWWLDSANKELIADVMEEQAGRYDADVWQEPIEAWLATSRDANSEISVDEVLTVCIGKARPQCTRADKTRVAQCLKALGWERFDQRLGKEEAAQTGKQKIRLYRRKQVTV